MTFARQQWLSLWACTWDKGGGASILITSYHLRLLVVSTPLPQTRPQELWHKDYTFWFALVLTVDCFHFIFT